MIVSYFNSLIELQRKHTADDYNSCCATMISLSVVNGVAALIAAIVGFLFIRLTICLPSFSASRTKVKLVGGKKASTLVVWGSGTVFLIATALIFCSGLNERCR